ncbi:pesticidal protein Cry7Aa [Candidatus Parcubacteria bacterium]|nr:pesticidal protein Cry7Aa [Patescibacteria group bacterium]MBU4309486.1 pesticidal protein Cry7Aa [Patescibacteria group bacterium]MBU4432106.1 pesticidal protein Cry7Aa [Patescibacteria group bacterium]MBU4577192.1 pesticidal protein Cry7Aa [Patescibacteria group bacterium]MCG2696840.1 pesticidal protein Cry7Aa [Candidatus Parcubacteria bacterium]
MLEVKKEGVILRPTNLEFENKSVFNPGILQEGNTVHMVYRAIDENNKSCLGYARLEGPMKVVERWTKPFMYPHFNYEKMGIEDPRLVKINDLVYMTYVVHDGKNAMTAYSSGKDLFHLKKGGIISPQLSYNRVGKLFGFSKLKDDYYTFKSYYTDYVGEDVTVWDKDGFFFPEKIKNKYVFMHRILPDTQIAPAKHIYFLKTKEYWERNIKQLSKFVVLEPEQGWENRHVGGGCPPIRTKYGWLLIYHGVGESNDGRIYSAGACILKIDNPTHVIARLPKPFMVPTKKYETNGTVSDVTFPTGTAIFDDRLYIYYGTADTNIAVASVNLDEFLEEIMKYPVVD